jgi:hypothetical protein
MNDSFFGRLTDLVTRPARLAENIGAAPRWWQPGLLVFVLICGFSYLTLPISAPEQLEMMHDSKIMQMMPEGQWQQQYDDALNVPPTKRLLQAVGAGFTTWLMIILFSLILGFFVRMGGGKGTFRQALGLGSWTAVIPFGIASIVKLPLVLATESVFAVNLGLAALLPGGDPRSPLYQVLMTYGDLFTWWGLIVLIIGFRQVFGLPQRAAALSVILPWILLSAIPLGMSLLFM